MSDEQIQKADFFMYTGSDGAVKVEVFFEGETVWLTQKRMAELFAVETQTINYHLKEVYASDELTEAATIRKIRTVRSEGDRSVEREVSFYNLDAIISVGYRVNSRQATHFRVWATQTLRNFMIKGYALDDERLKNGTHFGKDYFDELLEKIREIRASERRFYQKITDIYATAVDYQSDSDTTKEFYATVQNKLHFAIHGHTAAELIASKASAEKEHMGLKTWKNSPSGKILKTDVIVGKNYLSEAELKGLNRIVSMYLDYAENQAARGIGMKTSDWSEKINAFLQFNEYEILNDQGKISAATAKKLAEKEYEKFRPIQDKLFKSDFDKEVGRLKNNYKEKISREKN